MNIKQHATSKSKATSADPACGSPGKCKIQALQPGVDFAPEVPGTNTHMSPIGCRSYLFQARKINGNAVFDIGGTDTRMYRRKSV